ncbi:MAG: purine-nucleoside phosphorylase [Candidatus Peregrinibacteria bacterium]|nr:purine-nucleoside phosphorylase [Candidatus Peregrinibacteria bacterium]
MENSAERFGYDDASRARDFLVSELETHGMDPTQVKDMVILGSGLDTFGIDYMNEEKTDSESGPVKTPFNKVYDGLGIDRLEGSVKGHARSLVVGPMNGDSSGRLVLAQSGREHPYENVPTRRATFWLRVAQLMGVENLIGSNASGSLTPQGLGIGDLMLVHSEKDYGNDNPLTGSNDERFGPRFPHRGDHYPRKMRELVMNVAERNGIGVKEGTYVRMPGPNYESTEQVYDLRAVLDEMWYQGRAEGDVRFQQPFAVGTAGMSSTYENMVAQHASQSEKFPAFKNRAYLSAVTNYAAMLGPKGLMTGELKHDHVKDAAGNMRDNFGRLVREVLFELRR